MLKPVLPGLLLATPLEDLHIRKLNIHGKFVLERNNILVVFVLD